MNETASAEPDRLEEAGLFGLKKFVRLRRKGVIFCNSCGVTYEQNCGERAACRVGSMLADMPLVRGVGERRAPVHEECSGRAWSYWW